MEDEEDEEEEVWNADSYAREWTWLCSCCIRGKIIQS